MDDRSIPIEVADEIHRLMDLIDRYATACADDPHESATARVEVASEMRKVSSVICCARLMARNWEFVTGGYGPGGITPRALYDAVKALDLDIDHSTCTEE